MLTFFSKRHLSLNVSYPVLQYKDKEKYFKTLLIHFVKREKLQIVKKNREQLFSLCLNKKAKTMQNELEIKPVINLSTRKISKR